jgi:hypothetical protein
VARAIRLALVYNRKHVFPNCPKPGNWWVWAKQMPDCLCDILALKPDLTPDDSQYLISILDYLLGTGPIPGSGYHHGKAGMDALNVFKVGVLTGNRVRIAQAWEGMENSVAPFLLEPDGTPLMTCFSAENLGIALPYIYEGYGTVADWAGLARGTSMQLRPETVGKLTRYLLDLGWWNTWIPPGDPARATENAWISFTPYEMFWRPPRTWSLAQRLAAAEVARAADLKAFAAGKLAPPDGCRFWPTAETLIFRAPDCYAALVMASKARHRISFGYKNRFIHEGNKWYYGRDGLLVLATAAADMDPNLTYTADWRHLSGTTRDDGSILDSPQLQKTTNGYFRPEWVLCENPLAGAATLNGRDAVAGIAVRSGQTRARKSYFFIRDRKTIVYLGSDIAGRGGTETTLAAFPVEPGNAVAVVNGTNCVLAGAAAPAVTTPGWVHARQGGYYFPQSDKVILAAANRKPDLEDRWHPPKESEVPNQSFVSLVFDHGQNPTGGGYAAVQFLGVSAAEVPALAADFKERARWERNAAAHFLQYGAFAAMVFFQPGEICGYRADRPCFLALRDEPGGIRLAVYEPSWTPAALALQLPFAVVGVSLPEGCMADARGLRLKLQPGTPVEISLRRAL